MRLIHGPSLSFISTGTSIKSGGVDNPVSSNNYRNIKNHQINLDNARGRRRRDRMVVGFTTTYVISA